MAKEHDPMHGTKKHPAKETATKTTATRLMPLKGIGTILASGLLAAAIVTTAAALPVDPNPAEPSSATPTSQEPNVMPAVLATPTTPAPAHQELIPQVAAKAQGWALPSVQIPDTEPQITSRTGARLSRVAVEGFSIPAAVAFSKDSNDLTGRKPSLYRGKYFDPRFEQYRLCVSKRESEHTGSVRGGGGDRYTGFYQFSPELARGATWMMMDEAREDGLAEQVERLRGKPMNTWPRYFQDWAFWRVFNSGDGAHHWAGGRWNCNPKPNAERGW